MADKRIYDLTAQSSEDTGLSFATDKSGLTEAVKVAYSDLKTWFKVGDQQYTDENYVANDETLTASIDALDQQVKQNADDISASSTNIHIAEVWMYAADILAGNSIPKEIIAAQGDYVAIDILSAVATNVFYSSAYDASTNKIYLRYDGESTGIMEWSNSFLEASATVTHKGVIASDVVMPTNKKIEAWVENANPTLGDGRIKFTVIYRLITTPTKPA